MLRKLFAIERLLIYETALVNAGTGIHLNSDAAVKQGEWRGLRLVKLRRALTRNGVSSTGDVMDD